MLGGVGDVVEGFAFVIVLLPGADNPAQDAQAHGIAGGGHDQAAAGHLYGLARQQGTACAMQYLVLIHQADAEADQPFAVHLRRAVRVGLDLGQDLFQAQLRQGGIEFFVR